MRRSLALAHSGPPVVSIHGHDHAAALAGADRTELEEILTPTGFFRAKADSLLKLGAAVLQPVDGPGAQPPARPG